MDTEYCSDASDGPAEPLTLEQVKQQTRRVEQQLHSAQTLRNATKKLMLLKEQLIQVQANSPPADHPSPEYNPSEVTSTPTENSSSPPNLLDLIARAKQHTNTNNHYGSNTSSSKERPEGARNVKPKQRRFNKKKNPTSTKKAKKSEAEEAEDNETPKQHITVSSLFELIIRDQSSSKDYNVGLLQLTGQNDNIKMDPSVVPYEFVSLLLSEALQLKFEEKLNTRPMPPTIIVSDSSKLEVLCDLLRSHQSQVCDTLLKSIEYFRKKESGDDFTRANLLITGALGLNKVSMKTPSHKLPSHNQISAFNDSIEMVSNKSIQRVQLRLFYEMPTKVYVILEERTVLGVLALNSESESDDDDLLAPVILPKIDNPQRTSTASQGQVLTPSDIRIMNSFGYRAPGTSAIDKEPPTNYRQPAPIIANQSTTTTATNTKTPTSNGSKINPINLSSEFSPPRRNPPLCNGVNECSICLTNVSNCIFVPCGHMAFCDTCNETEAVKNLAVCTICRCSVFMTQRTYS